VTARFCESFLQNSVARQFALFDCLINSRQILVNDSARSEVKVPDFRVAHLAFGQTNVTSACAQFGPWVIPVELVMEWSRREQGGITVFLSLALPARINAPAVAYDEHYRTSHTSRTLPMNERMDKRFFSIAARHLLRKLSELQGR
jgi:hypothetical protein